MITGLSYGTWVWNRENDMNEYTCTNNKEYLGTCDKWRMIKNIKEYPNLIGQSSGVWGCHLISSCSNKTRLRIPLHVVFFNE